ncbi:MAG: sigma-70 family RNA polymerase sigma factor [Polyangiaceae bacterium]|nr:sigma-70 family RNA polymerase sigma factor [Polyangiaceae bacterium]
MRTYSRAPWEQAADISFEASPHQRLERQQAARVLHQMLERLDDDQREAFILAEFEQMTAPEIAEATGTNLNTVYARVRASRRSIADMLRRWHSSERTAP